MVRFLHRVPCPRSSIGRTLRYERTRLVVQIHFGVQSITPSQLVWTSAPVLTGRLGVRIPPEVLPDPAAGTRPLKPPTRARHLLGDPISRSGARAEVTFRRAPRDYVFGTQSLAGTRFGPVGTLTPSGPARHRPGRGEGFRVALGLGTGT